MRRLAVRTFEAMGCEGLARVDVFVTRDRRGRRQRDQHDAGVHADSMYPRMWEPSGMSYPELVDELLQLALTRRTGLR